MGREWVPTQLLMEVGWDHLHMTEGVPTTFHRRGIIPSPSMCSNTEFKEVCQLHSGPAVYLQSTWQMLL